MPRSCCRTLCALVRPPSRFSLRIRGLSFSDCCVCCREKYLLLALRSAWFFLVAMALMIGLFGPLCSSVNTPQVSLSHCITATVRRGLCLEDPRSEDSTQPNWPGSCTCSISSILKATKRYGPTINKGKQPLPAEQEPAQTFSW